MVFTLRHSRHVGGRKQKIPMKEMFSGSWDNCLKIVQQVRGSYLHLKRFLIAPFVRPPAIVHCSIVICVPRDWLQTTYIIKYSKVLYIAKLRVKNVSIQKISQLKIRIGYRPLFPERTYSIRDQRLRHSYTRRPYFPILDWLEHSTHKQ